MYSVYRTIGVDDNAVDELVATFLNREDADKYVMNNYGRLYVSRPWQWEDR